MVWVIRHLLAGTLLLGGSLLANRGFKDRKAGRGRRSVFIAVGAVMCWLGVTASQA